LLCNTKAAVILSLIRLPSNARTASCIPWRSFLIAQEAAAKFDGESCYLSEDGATTAEMEALVSGCPLLTPLAFFRD
jgi:hypothetical protein